MVGEGHGGQAGLLGGPGDLRRERAPSLAVEWVCRSMSFMG